MRDLDGVMPDKFPTGVATTCCYSEAEKGGVVLVVEKGSQIEASSECFGGLAQRRHVHLA